MKKLFSIYEKYQEKINYLIFGGLTTVVNLITYYIFTRSFGLSELVSNIPAWIIAVTFAYTTNRMFVFRSKDKNILKEIISFFIFRILSLIIDMLMIYIFVNIFNFNDMLIKVISNIIVIILNYIFSKLFVFKEGR
ncbi:MAG: GtrA family protein [bacterium]|nr:GtrA family protein [bacterium]